MTIHYAAALLALTLVSCNGGSSSPDTEAPASPVPAPAPEMRSPDAEPPAREEAAPAEEPDPASTSDPAPEARPARVAGRAHGVEPPLDEMSVARPVGKIGVPVDVRYQVSGIIAANQPATVRLAFVPGVAGRNLQVDFPDTPGVTIDAGSRYLRAEKPTTADVLRHSVLVTPTTGEGGEMRAIVSMDVDGSRFFSVFAIPVGAQPQTSSAKRPKG